MTVFSFLQPSNALVPICLILLPMVTVFSFFLPLKALSAIFVTGTLKIPTLMVAGIVTVAVSFLGPL